MNLNLGCGSQVPAGWINVDYALGARLAKSPFFRKLNKIIKFFDLDWDERIYIHNLNRPFPWKDGTVDIIYSSHTLEHFSKKEGLVFLNECHRVLRNGGIIRIIVPDLAHIIKEYSEQMLRADEFIEKLDVLYVHSNNLIKDKLSFIIQFPHKCMYDTQTILSILRKIGFNAKSRNPFDSDIDDIVQIELKERTVNAVIVEGIKW
jgi:SAM-dependent methyltransferase